MVSRGLSTSVTGASGVNLLFLLGALIVPLLIIGLIVFAVRQFVGRDGVGGSDGRGVRRFFQYLLLYGLSIVAAVGLSGLLGRLLEGPTLVSDDGPALARALTFSVIGVPLFWVVGTWSRRRLQEDREEARSLGWTFYATAAPVTALAVAMFALHDVISWVLRVDRYDGPALARLMVWGGFWLAHWLVVRRLTDDRRSQVHLAVGALIGLGTSVSGFISLLGAALEAVMRDGGGGVVVGERNQIAAAAATLLTGAPVWSIYWLGGLSKSPRTPLWFGYVLPLGVGGGLVTAIVAGSTVLYDTLVWFFGEPFSTDAFSHFRNAPTAIAAVAAGWLVWWYHREVLEHAKTSDRTEVGRVYEYLVAGIGLLAAAGGITTVLVAVIEAITGSGGIDVGTAPINTLLAALTLLVVGGPVWWIFWRRIQRAVAVDAEEELTSPTRRIYLFILFGLGGVVAVIALLVGVFITIEDILESRFGSEAVRSMRFALGLLATTGAIAAYHWAVYRQDRGTVPALRQPGPRYILLIGQAGEEIPRQVARSTGARVDLWPRTDGMSGSWTAADVAAALVGTDHLEVVVVSGPTGIDVIGIDRD